MGILTILLIAISLSFDSFAVSVSSGMSMCRKSLQVSQTLKIALSLAVFQAAFPFLGWWLGGAFRHEITQADHWIAFGLLTFLGIRMILEGRVPIKKRKVKHPTRWQVLIPMSVATSIDAFAVGIGFSFFVEDILTPVIIIGIVTFAVSMSGLYMGRKLGQKVAGIGEIVGGIVLILIGLKILIEHLFFL
ncbi:MAG: manganese efflux pump MntP family protein [Prolixibacteraceae bacterium]|jgi:putative Mn2+ efflux pump MntP|nr:manganese efflux pump MntP family protein [Prolixibacteraceae bacterium]